ncbi:alpha-taxilin-like isoform X1, partial [Lates japonicus]
MDDEHTEGEAAAAACGSSSNSFDPMLEFSRRLEDIISTYSSAADLMDKQSVVEAEKEKMKEQAKDDITVTMET